MKRLLRLTLLYLLALLCRPFVRRAAPAGVVRVLLLRPDHLGDLVLATPALQALREQLPQAQITLAVGPWSRAVATGNPHIDTLQVLPFPGFERAATSSFALRLAPYSMLLRYGLLLRRTRYAAALVLRDDHWWGAALALLAGIPQRIGYATAECRPLLSVALPWTATEHATLQSLRLVAQLVGQTSEDGAIPTSLLAYRSLFVVSAADSAWAEQWLTERDARQRPLLIIHPGTGGPAKLWLPERWAALADALLDANSSFQLLVTGGPTEQELVATVAASMRHTPLTLMGGASLGQLAALLARAELVLGVDSGPLHLAAAVGVPTLHLYGPGDAGRFGPWGSPQRQVVVRAGLWCSPCGVFTACPRKTNPSECMERISVAMVLAAARRLLATA